MGTPLVSIIIPCHNAEPWLAATLESALAQTWPAIEIIVIDDGSRDRSRAVAESFGRRGVRLATQSNLGASAARNHGIRLSTGAFIQYLDADDLLSPDKIDAQMRILLSAPPRTIASGRWARFVDDPTRAEPDRSAILRDFQPARDFLIHQAATSEMIQPAAWLTPRSLVESAGPWDESLTLNDDGEYFCRVVLQASGVRHCPEGTAYYRSAVRGSLSRRRTRSAMISLHRSILLTTGHLLAAEDSARVRSALANHWKRVEFELYPEAPELSADAGRRSAEFGRASIKHPFGPRSGLVAAVLGWRIARRLQRRGRP